MRKVGYLDVVNALTAGYASLALIRTPQVSTGTYLVNPLHQPTLNDFFNCHE